MMLSRLLSKDREHDGRKQVIDQWRLPQGNKGHRKVASRSSVVQTVYSASRRLQQRILLSSLHYTGSPSRVSQLAFMNIVECLGSTLAAQEPILRTKKPDDSPEDHCLGAPRVMHS